MLRCYDVFMQETPFNRVIGNISNERREAVLLKQNELMHQSEWEDLKGHERGMTAEERRLVDLTNRITNEICEEYGAIPFDIPYAAIHIINESSWKSVAKAQEQAGGFYELDTQRTILKDDEQLVLTRFLFEEMLHCKFYTAAQITTEPQPRLHAYRAGLRLISRDTNHILFNALNEGLVAEIISLYWQKFAQNRELGQQMQMTRSIKRRFEQAGIRKTADGVDLSDVYHVYVPPEVRSGKISLASFAPEKRNLQVKRTGHQKEHAVFNALVDKIYSTHQKEFSGRKAVFDLFAKAAATGHMQTLRIVDKTFGTGTLRRIGELDADLNQLEEYVKGLKPLTS
jgi:hypothetical protein